MEPVLETESDTAENDLASEQSAGPIRPARTSPGPPTKPAGPPTQPATYDGTDGVHVSAIYTTNCPEYAARASRATRISTSSGHRFSCAEPI